MHANAEENDAQDQADTVEPTRPVEVFEPKQAKTTVRAYEAVDTGPVAGGGPSINLG